MEPLPQLAPFLEVVSGATEHFLAALGAVPHELRHHEPARHARHLASIWSVPLAEAGRATLFYADGAAALVLVPADRKVSAPTLRSFLEAAELRVLRADRGVGRIGWRGLPGDPGALPAVPALFGASILVDELTLATPKIVLSLDAGRSVALAPPDYVELVSARIVRIAGKTKLPDRLEEEGRERVGRGRFELP